MVDNKKHRLVEVEFYFTCSKHNDPFTHGDKVQFTTGNWYFHKTGMNYRGGTYKGLDISIGNSSKEYGGVLIRTIEQLATSDRSTIVCGPCKSVDHILEVCSGPTIKDLVDHQMKNNIAVENQSGPLFLQ